MLLLFFGDDGSGSGEGAAAFDPFAYGGAPVAFSPTASNPQVIAIGKAIAGKPNKTVTTSAIGLTNVAIGFTAAEIDLADVLVVDVETVKVRYSVSSTAPTTANGHPILADARTIVRGRELIKNFQIIATTGSAAVHLTLLGEA